MRFNFEATGIASVPFDNAKKASRLILDSFKEIPFWPQLPRLSFYENMYVQYSEGLPGLVVDEDKKVVYIDTDGVAETIEETYSRYMDGDVEFFKLSEKHAAGFHAFLDSITAADLKNMKYLKGQITGPISYGLFLTDQNKKSIIYDKDLFEILTKTLIMKARWQIRKMKKVFPAVMVFIDEPYLVSIGSSFINMNIEEAVKKLDEVIDAIRKEGALVGIHCCGNTDWPVLLRRDIDIISIDAYNFIKEFSLYGADIKNFVKAGKTIAWGIIPSSEAIEKETVKSLAERLKSAMTLLAEKGIARDSISSLITPSCGVGTLSEGAAKEVLDAARSLSSKFKP